MCGCGVCDGLWVTEELCKWMWGGYVGEIRLPVTCGCEITCGYMRLWELSTCIESLGCVCVCVWMLFCRCDVEECTSS